jgi:hypothetical protein
MVYCEKCGSIMGKIEKMNYRYIKYMFVCKCRNVGKVELYRGRRPWLTYPKRPLYNEKNNYICQNCETPVLWVNGDTVEQYSFAVICKCGVEYDMKFKDIWKKTEDEMSAMLDGRQK